MHIRRANSTANGQALIEIELALHLLGISDDIKQNYNQIYRAYNEKNIEVQRLHEEIELLRR